MCLLEDHTCQVYEEEKEETSYVYIEKQGNPVSVQ